MEVFIGFVRIIKGIIYLIIQTFIWMWWLVIPIVLFFIFRKIWLFYIQSKFLKKIKYHLLEIHIPKNIIKTPKSMENVFSTLYAIKIPPPKFKDKYLYGRIQLWLSFEIVGSSAGIAFYVRTPADYRNLVESQIYAQYPEAELVEVEDYVNFLPTFLPNQNYDLWGVEFAFAKPSPFPIRTYHYFEEEKEERRLDPLASLTEAMSKLKESERIWIQILIKPANDSWKKEGEQIINELLGKKPPKKEDPFYFLWQFLKNLVKAPIEPPTWDEIPKEGNDQSRIMFLTPGEKEVIEAIQRKISKLGFETVIRFVYIDSRSSFSRLNITSIMGSFYQFNSQNLNSFKIFFPSLPFGKGFFKKQKEFLKKAMLYQAYRDRRFNDEIGMILNTEELATIFHFPIILVEAPALRRLEAKKGEPPVNLPTI